MTFDEWWRKLNTRDLPNVQRYRVVCKMAYTEGQKHAMSHRPSVQPEAEGIMERLYQRLAPLAFMPAEVSQEEAKRLGYPHVRLNDVETVIREELFK